jgi:hypothetical protein
VMVRGAVCADRLPGNIMAPATSANMIGRKGTRISFKTLPFAMQRNVARDHGRSPEVHDCEP